MTVISKYIYSNFAVNIVGMSVFQIAEIDRFLIEGLITYSAPSIFVKFTNAPKLAIASWRKN